MNINDHLDVHYRNWKNLEMISTSIINKSLFVCMSSRGRVLCADPARTLFRKATTLAGLGLLALAQYLTFFFPSRLEPNYFIIHQLTRVNILQNQSLHRYSVVEHKEAAHKLVSWNFIFSLENFLMGMFLANLSLLEET